MKTNNNQSGFTIIELSISMAMLSVLLLIILFSILNITSVYNKGITLKRVNQSGRTIASEVQSDFRNANPSNMGLRGSNLGGTNVPTAICSGNDSYIWNVWGESGANTGLRFDGLNELITMVKVKDSGGVYCKPPFPSPKKEDSKALLGDDLVIRMPVESSTGGYGKINQFKFTISTPDDNSEIIYDASGRGACGAGQENDFCALNTFVVTSYAKGI